MKKKKRCLIEKPKEMDMWWRKWIGIVKVEKRGKDLNWNYGELVENCHPIYLLLIHYSLLIPFHSHLGFLFRRLSALV